jgi:5-methylcytosine-specific restriction endonuclease McrA
MRKSLARPRTIAYSRQSGRCFYCGLPMWSGTPENFALKYGLSPAQVRRLQCTGEHLQAHQDGGSSAQANIVAACLYCNQQRHRRKNPPPPDRFKTLVSNRISKGRWHDAAVLRRLQH